MNEYAVTVIGHDHTKSSPKIEVLEKPFEFHVLRERLERLGLTLGSR